MAYFNQYFKSTDINSPPFSGQASSLIHLTNCCLVDGYGWDGMAITSITRSGTTATATVSAANGLKLKTGMYITITGVTGPGGGDPALYNGTFLITVASTTTFTYTMSGTPSGTATGTPVASSKLQITTITRSGTTATVTNLHVNFSLTTNDYLTIEGATGGDAAYYNGTFKITVTSTTTFTYTMTGTPSGSATGSPLVYYKAGLQWARPFAAGTNSQTYRSADTASNRFYLQVIDNAATAGTGKEAQIYGAEVMSADQTVTSGQFPLAANFASGFCVRKSTTADATQRAWTFSGDSKTFYLRIISGDTVSQGYHGMGFGHFISFKSGDAYNTFIGGGAGFNNSNTTSSLFLIYLPNTAVSNTTSSLCVPRLYTQLGSGIGVNITGFTANAGLVQGGSSMPLTYPNNSDSGLYLAPMFLTDSVSSLRGRMPGIFCPLNVNPMQEGDEVSTVTGLTGTTLVYEIISSNNANGSRLVDKWGPWT